MNTPKRIRHVEPEGFYAGTQSASREPMLEQIAAQFEAMRAEMREKFACILKRLEARMEVLRERKQRAEERLAGLTTETGAGQWGSALAFAGALFGIEIKVFMVRVSYNQKPYRRALMETYGATCVPSPSPETHAGRAILEKAKDHPGSLGIAISEAVEIAATHDDTKYALGSVLNHVLTHQTVVGLEAMQQLEMAGDDPDVLVGCTGGGSNFAGLVFPLLGPQLRGGRRGEVRGLLPAVLGAGPGRVGGAAAPVVGPPLRQPGDRDRPGVQGPPVVLEPDVLDVDVRHLQPGARHHAERAGQLGAGSGARGLPGGSAVNFGGFKVVAARFESDDAPEKVGEFYRSRYPKAEIQVRDPHQQTLIVNTSKGVIAIKIQPRDGGSSIEISNVGGGVPSPGGDEKDQTDEKN